MPPSEVMTLPVSNAPVGANSARSPKHASPVIPGCQRMVSRTAARPLSIRDAGGTHQSYCHGLDRRTFSVDGGIITLAWTIPEAWSWSLTAFLPGSPSRRPRSAPATLAPLPRATAPRAIAVRVTAYSVFRSRVARSSALRSIYRRYHPAFYRKLRDRGYVIPDQLCGSAHLARATKLKRAHRT